jgi:hypothetical protein
LQRCWQPAQEALILGRNYIRAQGAQSLTAAHDKTAPLTTLGLSCNDIGAGGAQSLVAVLDKNATLTSLDLGLSFISATARGRSRSPSK